MTWTGLAGLCDHPFFRTQMVYDHAPEVATIPLYTRALWDRQHRLISADFARFKPAERVRLLDLGCGPGHIADSQAAHIESYVGVDPSLIELRRAPKGPGRQFIRGAAETIDFPANSFDAVFMVSVLDHCIDWHLALRNATNALSPGGLLLIVMENAEQLPSHLRRWARIEVEHHDHMHFINLPQIEEALGGMFTPLKVRTFGYGYGLQTLSDKVRLPRRVFDVALPAMDAIGQALAPRGGQILYGWYRKRHHQ